MSIELVPAELSFQRPFNREIIQKLYLMNRNHDPLVFKVKTTAPKKYCVRPNSGRIEAGKEVEVQVLLQAMKEDPGPNERCKDKFLVQTVPVPANEEFSGVPQIWSHIETHSKNLIQERKIRVVYTAADGTLHTPGAPTNGIHHATDPDTPSSAPPPKYESPAHHQDSPSANRGIAATTSDRAMPAPPAFDTPTSQQHAKSSELERDEPLPIKKEEPSSTTSGSIAQAIPTSTEELKAALASAQAQIVSLTQQAEQGLRQRKVPEKAQEAVAQVQQAVQSQEGVPVQIVAALCLLSFLLAYLFF